MWIKKKISIIMLLVIIGISQLPAHQGLRVKTYELDVTFIPGESSMKGQAVIHFDVTPGKNEMKSETLVFYLHGELTVDSLEMDGEKIPFSSDPVFYPSEYSYIALKVEFPLQNLDLSKGLTVVYSGFFNPSKARALSDYIRIDSDGVLLRAYGYSLWFPVFLDSGSDSYSVSFPKVIIRTPADFYSVFTGDRIRDYLEGNTRVSQWSAENVDLLYAQCTAQRYTILKKGGYHIYSYSDIPSREVAKKILTFAQQLESLYRLYYKKEASANQLHIMQMPEYGDISSGNVVGMSDENWKNFKEKSFSGWTLAHELVHPFVWIPTPRTDPLYALVREGFP